MINASRNGLFLTIGSAIKSALRASSEMLQKHAARPSEDIELHERVSHAILGRRPQEAADAMETLLIASRARLLPFTVGPAPVEGGAEAAAPARPIQRKARLRSAP